MLYICQLDRKIYSCISDNIVNDDVIITCERIQHIMSRHKDDFEDYKQYLGQIILEPDYIIEANKPKTAVILKEVKQCNKKFKVILRLKLNNDPYLYSNSVISFWLIGDTTWKKLLKNKKILYKKG